MHNISLGIHILVSSFLHTIIAAKLILTNPLGHHAYKPFKCGLISAHSIVVYMRVLCLPGKNVQIQQTHLYTYLLFKSLTLQPHRQMVACLW